MVKPMSSSPRVRVSQTLNDGEQEYVAERKRKIHKWLQGKGIDCELDEVPNIALLGSGGGERASVGLLGSLMQLIEDDLLDSILYMAGVSGSTWCMASLYKDAAWSMDERQCETVERIIKGPAVSFTDAVSWLRKRKGEDNDITLTDFWAAATISKVMKQMDYSLLSEQAHRNARNPYPIYSIIERDANRVGQKKETWFELTPHESGFSGLGAYVNTSSFRSQFEDRVLTEKGPEIDMILLQGLCGSAPGDGKRNKKELMKLIFGSNKSSKQTTKSSEEFESDSITVRKSEEECSCVPSRIIRCMNDLLEFTEDPEALMEAQEVIELINTMEDLLEGQFNSEGEELWSMDAECWQGINLEEREEFILTISHELILTSDVWTASWNDRTCPCFGKEISLEDTEFISDGLAADTISGAYQRSRDVLWAAKHIRSPLHEWKFGTTSNFLYRCQDPGIPSSLASKKGIPLIDAGLMINSPYPPVLRPERELDLIISLDFSAGDPFETVFLAKEYAKDMDLHFPKVDERVREDKDYPKDCYIFRGHSKEITVMHMPLFNRGNCKGKEDLENIRVAYKTGQLSYDPDKITHLLEKAKTNMINNRDRILDEIKRAIQRKRSSVRAPPMVHSLTASGIVQHSPHGDQEFSTDFPVTCSVPHDEEVLPKKAHTSYQGPPGYYLMPIGCNPFPVGPVSMQSGPGVTPVWNGWSWGAQHPAQQPAQNDRQTCPMPPPPPPPPAAPPMPHPLMPFPGYCLVPMVYPPWSFPAYSATYGSP